MKKVLLALALTIAAAAPAIAQPYAASHLAAAEELLDAANVRGAMDAGLESMLGAQLEQQPMLRELEGVMREFFATYTNWETMKPEFARLYAARFTESELREIAAFYRTPVGSKLARETPALTEEGGQLGRQMVDRHLPELQRMVMEHMQGNGQ
jgi:uncharacterized protein